jgi:hypothetical protein
MSEFLPILVFIVQLLNFLLIGLLIPFFKHIIELRLKVERMSVMLDIILKDVEKLKKRIYNGEGEENKD